MSRSSAWPRSCAATGPSTSSPRPSRACAGPRPTTASVIAQAIDESTLAEQVGTLAGDNTLIVLFPDEATLLRWLDRFNAIQAPAEPVIVTEALSR